MQRTPYIIEGNVTRVYSPVTLSHEWPALGRLLIMVCLSCIGTILNGFFVSAFFIERYLRRIGNVYLACIGLSDLIVTTAVMPVSAVVLLSGEWDLLPVCRALQFLTESSTYSYSLFFALVSLEIYYRLCQSSERYHNFICLGVGLVMIVVYATSFVVAGVGVYLGLDYDYCQRKNFGNFQFRCATFAIFHAVPFLVTMFGLISASVRIRHRARKQISYRRSLQYDRDYSITHLNITVYIFYVIAWIPYLIVVHTIPDTTDPKYYHSVWIGVCRSIFSSFLYVTMNRNFRRAFVYLFYYCCCKTTLTSSYNGRPRKAYVYKPEKRAVRVHIMHEALNRSPRRASSSHETQEL